MSISVLSFIFSVIVTAVTVGIAFGVTRTKVTHLEKDVENKLTHFEKDINSIGVRFTSDLKAIKDEYISQMSTRLKDSENDVKKILENFARMEERSESWQKNIEGKIDVINKTLEKKLP